MLCTIVTIPSEHGAGRPGCAHGPAALMAAGLLGALSSAGYEVLLVEVPPPAQAAVSVHRNPAIRNLPTVAAWVGSPDHLFKTAR